MRVRLFALLLVLCATFATSPQPIAAQDPSAEPIEEELLGDFVFVGDGVVNFFVQGDQIFGRVTQLPASTGIRLLGAARVGPCGFEDGVPIPFVLDRFGVGEWFFFSVDNAGDCVRHAGAEVRVEFNQLGADALGQRPTDHPNFDGIPTGHTMLRVNPLPALPPTTAPTTTVPAEPAAEPSTSTLDLENTIDIGGPDPTVGLIPADDGDDSWLFWVAALITLLTVVTVILYRRGWRPFFLNPPGIRDRTPTPPPAETPDEPEPESGCSCRASLVMEGPRQIGICCEVPTLTLRDCADQSGRTNGLDKWAIHVDGDLPNVNLRDFFDEIYSVSVVADCRGGGSLDLDAATTAWTVVATTDGFDLTCTATIPVRCPSDSGQPHEPIETSVTTSVSFAKEPCRIGIMIRINAALDISHVETHIVCGDYSETFGYYPVGARTFANTFPRCPGEVHRRRDRYPKIDPATGLTVAIERGLGRDYVNSNDHFAASEEGGPLKDWDIYWFVPESCETCEKMRNWWEELHRNPGNYGLLNNNCATTAWRAIEEAGLYPDDSANPMSPSDIAGVLDDAMAGRNRLGIAKEEIRR